MGLFNRRDETREQLEALRAELSTMRQRLDESEGAKQQLAEHLGRVEAEHQQLTSQVGSVESKVGDVEAVRADVVRLNSLAARVDDLSDSISIQRATLPPPTAAPDHDVLAVLQQQVDQLAELIARQREHIADIAVVATDSVERTDSALAEMRSAIDADATGQRTVVDTETRSQLGLLAEKVGAIDSRVNQVSLELTNQLTELSSDIDQAGSTSDVSAAIDDLVERLDEVTGGQERLANEQARYAIQFRNDLAELAERLRRPGSR